MTSYIATAGLAMDAACELAYERGRATEREAIIRLAEDHGAAYRAEPRPCPCKANCAIIVSPQIPFADLIRKERGNGDA